MPSRRYQGKAFQIEGKFIGLADPHLFHANILKYDGRTQFMTHNDLEIYEQYKKTGERGPRISDESVQKMNHGILDAINAEVEDPDKDTVLIIGDFVFGNSPNQYRRNAVFARDQINCKDVRIVWGNHDEPDEIYDLFTYSYEQALLYVGKQPCFANHYPLWCHDGPKDTIMLSGHVHGLYENPNHPHPFARSELWLGKDIGISTNNYKPYTMPLIQEKLRPIRLAREKLSESQRYLLH